MCIACGCNQFHKLYCKKYSIYVELGNKAACAACHVIFIVRQKVGGAHSSFCASGHFSDSYTSVDMDVSLHHFSPCAAHTGPSPPKPPLRLTQAQAHRSPLCGSHRPKPTEAPSAAHTGPSPPKPPLQLTQAQAHRSPLCGSHRPKPTKASSAAHPTETPSAVHTGPSPPKPVQLPKKTPLVVLHTALTLLYPTVFECR